MKYDGPYGDVRQSIETVLALKNGDGAHKEIMQALFDAVFKLGITIACMPDNATEELRVRTCIVSELVLEMINEGMVTAALGLLEAEDSWLITQSLNQSRDQNAAVH